VPDYETAGGVHDEGAEIGFLAAIPSCMTRPSSFPAMGTASGRIVMAHEISNWEHRQRSLWISWIFMLLAIGLVGSHLLSTQGTLLKPSVFR
jgi:hypothetical protein